EAPDCCSDAFSSREPVSTPLENALGFALALVIGERAAAGDLAAQLFEAPMCLVLVRVDEMHGGFARHRAADHGHGLLAAGLVEVVPAVVAVMDRPFQTDRHHRPRTDLAVAVGIGVLRHQWLLLDHRMLIDN